MSDDDGKARKLLQQAQCNVETGKVWIKSALLEWCLGYLHTAEKLLMEGVLKYPTSPKLWMMLSQVRTQNQNYKEAIQAYKNGCSKNPYCVTLWILRANLEVMRELTMRARNTLEKARSMIEASPELWLACVRLELRDGNKDLANNLMSRALHNCPNSGILWAESVSLATKKQKMMKAKHALTKCEHSEHVLLVTAKVFWEYGFDKKAREYLMKCLKTEKMIGDAWAYLYKYECIYGSDSSKSEVVEQCVAAEPRFGEYWCSISKDVANWKLKTKEILLLVAKKVPLPI